MPSSKLQKEVAQLLKRHFPFEQIRENIKPGWLLTESGKRLELDLFIEQRSIAFEIQGIQHLEYVGFFHRNYEDFQERQKRDVEKRAICERVGVELHEIFDIADAIAVVESKVDQTAKAAILPFSMWLEKRINERVEKGTTKLRASVEKYTRRIAHVEKKIHPPRNGHPLQIQGARNANTRLLQLKDFLARAELALSMQEKVIRNWNLSAVGIEKLREEYGGYLSYVDRLQSMPLSEYYKTWWWGKVCGRVFARNRYHCQFCDRPFYATNLHVFHISLEHRGFEMDYLDDLGVICEICKSKQQEVA